MQLKKGAIIFIVTGNRELCKKLSGRSIIIQGVAVHECGIKHKIKLILSQTYNAATAGAFLSGGVEMSRGNLYNNFFVGFV